VNTGPVPTSWNGAGRNLPRARSVLPDVTAVKPWYGVHVIGEIFDRVYREGDLLSPPGRSIQTTLVPAGGATVVEFDVEVPGDYTLVDHAIFRIEQGAVGFLKVEGEPRHDIYVSQDEAATCAGCLVHP